MPPCRKYHSVSSNFTFSQRSRNALRGVKPQLVAVVERALQLTPVDFVVLEGLRIRARQAQLVASGASQTMDSKHLTGNAVDLGAWQGTIRWELPLYYQIADAMKQAARELDAPIRWGGAWHIADFRAYQQSAERATAEYVSLRTAQKRKVFIDAPHFEI